MNLLVDIGGSGVKVACETRGVIGRARRHGEIDTFDGLVRVLRGACEGTAPSGVAVSAAGFVDADAGRVRRCRCAPYLEGDTVRELSKAFPGAQIRLVNDGEAHARALLRPERKTRFGAIHLALGTSVAFGVIDEQRRIVRPCDGGNWDVGDCLLRTREAPYEAWYRLGSAGLKELEQSDNDPYRRFGLRLGGFVRNLTVIFRPRTVGFSGGIVSAHGEEILRGVREELENERFDGPLLAQPPAFVLLKGENTAMEGLTTLLK